MRALIQRVAGASVTVENREVGSIGPGLVVLLGVAEEDTEVDAQYLVDKTVNLRIFADRQSRFNLSALDTGAQLLVVSQFTLYGDTRKGRRPGFHQGRPAGPGPAALRAHCWPVPGEGPWSCHRRLPGIHAGVPAKRRAGDVDAGQRRPPPTEKVVN